MKQANFFYMVYHKVARRVFLGFEGCHWNGNNIVTRVSMTTFCQIQNYSQTTLLYSDRFVWCHQLTTLCFWSSFNNTKSWDWL